MKWERPLVPKPRRKSQVQLVSLGLSQVEPDLGCPQQVSPLRARCLGARTLQGKDRLSGLVWGEPAISGVPLSSAGTFMSHTESQSGCPARPLGCQGAPAQSHSPKPASVSQGVSEKCPLSPPGLSSVEGWALQPRETLSLFGDSYQGSCLCCSSFRLLVSTTCLNMSRRA